MERAVALVAALLALAAVAAAGVALRLLSRGRAGRGPATSAAGRRALGLAVGSGLADAVCLSVVAVEAWTWGERELPGPYPTLLVAAAAAGLVWALATTFLPSPHPAQTPARHEVRRKVPHLLLGLLLLAFPLLGHAAALLLAHTTPAGPDQEAMQRLVDAPWSDAGQVFAAWFALLLTLVLTPSELARLLRPGRPFPFRRLVVARLRDRETDALAGHLHIAIGLAVALLLLGHDRSPGATAAAMATIAVTVFADAASALAGMRWGRRKWPHNAGKSLVGTLGGSLVAFGVTLPLAGPLAALACATLFALLDVAAPIPLPVSDNLLNPVATAALLSLPGLVQPLVPIP